MMSFLEYKHSYSSPLLQKEKFHTRKSFDFLFQEANTSMF